MARSRSSPPETVISPTTPPDPPLNGIPPQVDCTGIETVGSSRANLGEPSQDRPDSSAPKLGQDSPPLTQSLQQRPHQSVTKVPPSDIPEGWNAVWGEAVKTWLYYEADTGKSQWERLMPKLTSSLPSPIAAPSPEQRRKYLGYDEFENHEIFQSRDQQEQQVSTDLSFEDKI
ncbi:hypothetical protein BDZ45DRAFT_693152 [Acephala macrosclerotiorum]|nr:hypothetical protein BDZ45DRAFT_693152 [Acephala macrosclerotiorum]